MYDSCCICSMVLAPDDSNFPLWCKDIRAVCWFENRPTLSGKGSMDSDDWPFSLPIPSHGFSRFCHRRSWAENEARAARNFCYPFHSACWTLLQENDDENLLHDIEILYNIFESVHDHDHVLRWGHNYFLDEILDSSKEHEDDMIAVCKADKTLLVDPLLFNFNPELDWKRPTHAGLLSSCLSRSECGSSRLHSLSPEIFESVMYNLDTRDSRSLLWATGKDFHDLSSSFWESRFWPHGETGFARSIRPLSYSWKDWFFTIQSELIRGPNRMNLRNRKRIWRLGAKLIDLVRAINEPKRVLRGDIATLPLCQMRGSVASCLAQQYDIKGCRELAQRFVPLENRLRAVVPSYILLSNERFVSGLSFALSDTTTPVVDVGYVVSTQRHVIDYKDSPKFLWLVFSPLGFKAVSLDVYPQQFLDSCSLQHGNNLAIARWKLENLQGICVGIDAMRIVRICMDIQKQDNLDDILWTPPYPYPLSALYMLKDDIATLSTLQKGSFAPASTHFVNLKNRRLLAIKIYSPLGYCAGITGIGFVYNTGVENIWGSVDSAASLVFFLNGIEQIAKVIVYKKSSLVCHLQFSTDLHRTSDPFPPLPINPNIPLDCVEYKASNGGCINGFCGRNISQFKYRSILLPRSTGVQDRSLVSSSARVRTKTILTCLANIQGLVALLILKKANIS